MLTESDRAYIDEHSHNLDKFLYCFLELDTFKYERVREKIDCPSYIKRVPGQTPAYHLEKQQALAVRHEAEHAADRQRRQGWIIAGITVTAVVVGGVVSAIIGALIGRGTFFPP